MNIGNVFLKGDPILGDFLHKILGKVLLMKSLDVFTLFVNQNMSYFVEKNASPKCKY